MKHTLMAAVGVLALAAGAAHAQQGASAFDTNGDGKVTFDEFADGRGKRLFGRLDVDKDGKLTSSEFTAINIGGQGATVFAHLDANKDGFVTEAEARVMAQLSFQRADTDGDGALSDSEIAAIQARRAQ